MVAENGVPVGVRTLCNEQCPLQYIPLARPICSAQAGDSYGTSVWLVHILSLTRHSCIDSAISSRRGEGGVTGVLSKRE